MNSQIKAHTKNIDTLPLTKYYMAELGIYDLFKEFVPKGNALVEPAEGLCMMINNIINSRKPLYKIEDWVADYADGRGEAHINASTFNNHRLSRDLDSLYASERHSLMTRVSANAIRVHRLETQRIHNDTTSLTLFGCYDNSSEGESAQPACGYNKDGHPDCKQLVFGLNITEDGHVPLSYEIYDGNTSDSDTHRPNWEALRQQLQKEDFIYLADSKLCSLENLAYISENKGKFITIIPKNRKEVKKFYTRLKNDDISWSYAFKRPDSRSKGQSTVYQIYEGEKTREGYRITWVHSSAKARTDKKARQKLINNTLTNLEELASKLNRYNLKTRPQIRKALTEALKPAKDYINCKIIKDKTTIINQIGRGKPGPNTNYREDVIVSFRLQGSINKKAVAAASCTDGVFPLVDNTALCAQEVLETYKEQAYLEKRHSTLKSVLEVSPIFLKKPKRIEAIIFLFFIALMIVSLIERNIRNSMTEALPILPKGMKTQIPTWENIRYFFRNVHQIVVIKGQLVIKTCLKGMTSMHEQLLKLLEVPMSIYKKLNERWWEFGST